MDQAAPLSLFTLLHDNLGAQLVPIQATKATLVDVSHILEDLVIAERLPAMIFTGFQESSHWREETARYRDLADVAHQICIFAGGELPGEQEHNQIHVRLRGPDPLRQEWFLLVLSERFSAVLCGRDAQLALLSESDRRFDTIWSFEPAIIARTLELLREVVARERPERLADLDDALRRFPPTAPDASLITRFTSRLIDDLTQQHQTRLHLERVLAYESRLRALGQVLSGVAHELNNPLQSILGFASLITEAPLVPAETTADAQHIVEAAERAREIVRSLLQLARPVSGGFTPTNLVALVESTLIFVRSDLEANTIRAEVHALQETVTVYANPVRLQQLLINLLTNAIQALARHPTPRRIMISVAQAEAMGALTVQDNGPGIPPQLHERVFEPFFTTKPIGEGTGLGLSIVRTIVQEHGGTISLASAAGSGTSFHILLPVASGAVLHRAEAIPHAGRGKILLIDDDPQVNALVARVLNRAGYQVKAEIDPLVAREHLTQSSYDAIVCDLLMPGLSGMELYEELMQINPALARRLVFVTGDATRATTQAFLEGTGQPHVAKPFTPKQLLMALARILPSALDKALGS